MGVQRKGYLKVTAVQDLTDGVDGSVRVVRDGGDGRGWIVLPWDALFEFLLNVGSQSRTLPRVRFPRTPHKKPKWLTTLS